MKCSKPYNQSSSVAGLVAVCKNGGTYNDCSVSNIDIFSEYNASAGFIGCLINSANISDCEISDINIKNSNEQLDPRAMGGAIGIISSDGCVFDNIKLKNITLNGGCYRMGGFIGSTNKGDIIQNIEADNINVNNTLLNAGGIVGEYICISDDVNSFSINNVCIKNSNIKSGIMTGGIIGVGCAYINNAVVENCNISNSYSLNQGVGGIIGNLYQVDTNKTGIIKKSTVKNSTIEGKGCAGGIAGYGVGIISENKVLNTSVTSTENNVTGGIVGFCYGLSSKLMQNTVSNSIIIGNKDTGGIAGFSEGNLQENIVNNNTKITTTDNDSTVGGIVGIAPNSSSEITGCNVDQIIVTGQNGYTGGIVGFSNNTINGCNVKNSNIIAKGVLAYGLGGIIGHGSNVLEKGLTVIRNCSVERCELTGKDAVGGIAGSSVPEITNCVVNGNLVNSLSLLDDIAGNQDLQDLETTDNAGLTGFSLMSYFASDEQNQVVDSVIDVSDEDDVLDETEGDEEQQNDNGQENEGSIENNDEGLDDNAQDELSDDKIQDEFGNEEQDDENGDDLNDDELGDIEADVSESDNDDIDVKEGIKEFEEVVDNVLIGFSNKINKFISRIFRVKDDKTIIKGQSVVLAENGTEEVSEDDYGVKIKGNRFVGGIIGNSGELSSDDYSSVKITNCLVNNTYIRGSADVDYTIGKRLTFSEGYSGCASNLEDSVDELTEWLESIFEVK